MEQQVTVVALPPEDRQETCCTEPLSSVTQWQNTEKMVTNASLFRQGERLDLARFKVHGIATKSIRALN